MNVRGTGAIVDSVSIDSTRELIAVEAKKMNEGGRT